MLTKCATEAARSSKACSVCGDDPAKAYVLVAETCAGGQRTLRLFEDRVHIRRGNGDAFVPLRLQVYSSGTSYRAVCSPVRQYAFIPQRSKPAAIMR